MRRSGQDAKSKQRDAARHALPAHQSRSRATRARILAAAEEEFAEKGYEGARIADIAARAGCSVGAVYFRFKDKSALFLAIVESFAEGARANLKMVLENQDGARIDDIVGLFVRGAAHNFRLHKGLFRAIVERGLDHPEAMQTMFRLRDEFAAALKALLAAAGRRDTALQVRVMTQMIYGFMMIGVLNPDAPASIADSRAVNELAGLCASYLGERRS